MKGKCGTTIIEVLCFITISSLLIGFVFSMVVLMNQTVKEINQNEEEKEFVNIMTLLSAQIADYLTLEKEKMVVENKSDYVHLKGSKSDNLYLAFNLQTNTFESRFWTSSKHYANLKIKCIEKEKYFIFLIENQDYKIIIVKEGLYETSNN